MQHLSSTVLREGSGLAPKIEKMKEVEIRHYADTLFYMVSPSQMAKYQEMAQELKFMKRAAKKWVSLQ